MKNALLLFAFAGLLSCSSPNQIQPSPIIQRYFVTTYVVGGDTLFSQVLSSGRYQIKTNKINIGYFFITRERADEGQELITYDYYREDLTPKLKREVKPFVLSDYLTGFSPFKEEAGISYEGRLRNSTGVYSERNVGGGLFIPLKGLPGLPNATTTDKEVVIVAVSQR